MSEVMSVERAWPRIVSMAESVAGEWVHAIRGALADAAIKTSDGWWVADAAGEVFGKPAQVRLFVEPVGGSWVLRVRSSATLVPSDAFGGLLFGGAPNATMLDFLQLEQPTLYLSNFDSEGKVFNPVTDEHTADPVTPGLSLIARLEAGTSLSEGSGWGVLVRPLNMVVERTKALPARVVVSVGSQAASALFAPERPWSVSAGPVSATLSNRCIGVTLARAGSGDVEGREAPETYGETGGSTAAPTDELTMQSDVDLTLDLGGSGGFPQKDTAPMTLGTLIGEDPPGTLVADGWMKLRVDEQTGWDRPFGVPGLNIHALYARLDLVTEELKAIHGNARFAGQQFDVAMAMTEAASADLVAFRNETDVSLLGIGAALLGTGGGGSDPGPVLQAHPAPSTTDPEAPVDPSDYSLYISSGEVELDGRTWPAGLVLDGTIDFWGLEAAVDLGITWTDQRVSMTGKGLELTVPGSGFTLHLGLPIGDDLPLRITVTRQPTIVVELDFSLGLGPVKFEGAAVVGPNGLTIGRPGAAQPVDGVDVGVRGVKSPDGDLTRFEVDAYAAYTWTLAAHLAVGDVLQSLPGGDVSVTGELDFTVDVAVTPPRISAKPTRLKGRIPALGASTSVDVSDLGVDLTDLGALGPAIEEKLASWAKDQIPKGFGELPLVGPLLRNLYGLADDALGKVLNFADSLPGFGDVEANLGKGLDTLLGELGVARGFVDDVAEAALGWATDNRLPVGGALGGWALDLGGKGFEQLTKGLKSIPGVGDVIDGVLGGKTKHLMDWRSMATEVGAVLAFQTKDYGGKVIALPPGDYWTMPGEFAPTSGDGNGANALAIPLGMWFQGWTKTNLKGESKDYFESNHDLGHWTDRFASARVRWNDAVTFVVAGMGIAGFFGPHAVSTDSVPAAPDPLVIDKADATWLAQVIGVMVPPGFEVTVRNVDGGSHTFTGSVPFLTKAYGDDWKPDRLTRAEIRRSPIQWQTPSAFACGRVPASAWTAFQDGTGRRLASAIIDLEGRGMRRPRVFMSLGGASEHYAAWGITAASSGTDVMRVIIGWKNGDVPLDAVRDPGQWGWHLDWVAFDQDFPMLVQGTDGGFEQYPPTGDGLKIAMSHDPAWVDGAAAPALTTLRGPMAAIQLGAGATYNTYETGLSVYLTRSPLAAVGYGSALTPHEGWDVDYARPLFGRAGITHGGKRFVSGRTAPGVGWTRHSDSILTLRVDTRGLGLAGDVMFITSLSGASSHWTLCGGSSIYDASADGFRVYLYNHAGGGLTPAQANRDRWHIHWVAICSA